jgi:hypothetical protein
MHVARATGPFGLGFDSRLPNGDLAAEVQQRAARVCGEALRVEPFIVAGFESLPAV